VLPWARPRHPLQASRVPGPQVRTPAAARTLARPRASVRQLSPQRVSPGRVSPGRVSQRPTSRRLSRPDSHRGGLSGCSTRHLPSTAGRTWRPAETRRPATTSPAPGATTRARAARAVSSSAATATRGCAPTPSPSRSPGLVGLHCPHVPSTRWHHRSPCRNADGPPYPRSGNYRGRSGRRGTSRQPQLRLAPSFRRSWIFRANETSGTGG
jgi:hypothetical protein